MSQVTYPARHSDVVHQPAEAYRSRDDCMSSAVNWDTKKADCLRKYAIWTQTSSTATSTRLWSTSTTVTSSTTPTDNLQRSLETIVGLDSVEARSVNSPPDEWEGFLCYVIPSVSVVIICISLAILAFFLIEYLHKKRQRNGWSASGSRADRHSRHPNAPHMLFLSRDQYSRANSITSFVSLPPAYNTVAKDEKRHSKSGSKESPPPSYEVALNNLAPARKI